MTLFSKVSKVFSANKVVSTGIIMAVCLIVGYFAPHVTGKKDGHLEQMAEHILKQNGIDIDFSPE